MEYKTVSEQLEHTYEIKKSIFICTIKKINSFDELNNLDVVIKIGVEHDKNGQYQDKNRVIAIITPDHFSYSEFMNGQDIPWSR